MARYKSPRPRVVLSRLRRAGVSPLLLLSLPRPLFRCSFAILLARAAPFHVAVQRNANSTRSNALLSAPLRQDINRRILNRFEKRDPVVRNVEILRLLLAVLSPVSCLGEIRGTDVSRGAPEEGRPFSPAVIRRVA